MLGSTYSEKKISLPPPVDSPAWETLTIADKFPPSVIVMVALRAAPVLAVVVIVISALPVWLAGLTVHHD